jgi:hypothetical protein
VVYSSRATSSGASDNNDADSLSEEEKLKRRALEYEEDEDAPEPSKLPGIEKDYTLQNLGVPRSSDGNVSVGYH